MTLERALRLLSVERGLAEHAPPGWRYSNDEDRRWTRVIKRERRWSDGDLLFQADPTDAGQWNWTLLRWTDNEQRIADHVLRTASYEMPLWVFEDLGEGMADTALEAMEACNRVAGR